MRSATMIVWLASSWLYRRQVCLHFPTPVLHSRRDALPPLPADYEVHQPPAPEDAAAIAGLLNQEPGFGQWTAARVRTELLGNLAHPKSGTLVLHRGLPVATAFATDASTRRRRVAHGMYLYVAPGHRSRAGLAAFVVYGTLGYCLESGYERVLAFTDPDRYSALLLYLSTGVVPVPDCLSSLWHWRKIRRRLGPALERAARGSGGSSGRRGASRRVWFSRAGGIVGFFTKIGRMAASGIYRRHVCYEFPASMLQNFRDALPTLPAEYTLRQPALVEDAACIATLLNQEPGFGVWNAARVQSELLSNLAHPKAATLVLHNDTPVAVAFATDASTRRRRVAHGMYLYVAPSHRGHRGLGAFIVYGTLGFCLDAGYGRILGFTDPDRYSALLLYLSNGVRPVYDSASSVWYWRKIRQRLGPALQRAARLRQARAGKIAAGATPAS